MFESWLDVLLLRPLPHIPRQTDRAMELRDAAVLLLGDVREYQHMRYSAPTLGLPPHDDDEWQESVDRALVVGLLNQLLAHVETATDVFRWVITNEGSSPDAVAAASALGSIALADSNDLGAALGLVDDGLVEVGRSSGAASVLLEVHRGARLAALGRWDEAAAEVPNTEVLADDDVHEILRRAAHANGLLFRRRTSDEWLADLTPPDPLPPTLRWRLGQLASSTTDILEADLRDACARAGSGEWHHLRSATAHQLWSVAFNAACRGHIQHTAAAYSTLGRHRVIDDLHLGVAPSLDTYQTLLDAGDNELDRVARRYLRAGPIDGLPSLADMAASRAWESVDTKPTLDVLASLGQLLDVDAADALARRLIAFIDQPQAWNTRESAVHALVGTLTAASDSIHQTAAERTLRWLADADDDRWSDSLSSVLRWPAVDRSIRQRARASVEQWAAGHGTEAFSSLLLPLTRTAGIWGRRQAATAFATNGNLRRAALVLDTGTKAPNEVLDHIRALAISDIGSEVAQAAAGHYGLGGINSALVLTVVLLRREGDDPEGWSVIASYLSNPKILARQKEPVLDAIAVSADELRPNALEILRGALRAGIVGEGFFGDDSPEMLMAPAMRASMAIGNESPSRALDHLRELMGSTPSDRLAAADSLPMAAQLVPVAQVVDLGMVLLWDGDVDVRATAAVRMIDIWQRRRVASTQATAISHRLSVLLREDGTGCPLAILRRVPSLQGPKRSGLIDGVLTALTDAPSALVRGAAANVAKRWRLDAG